MNSKMPAIDLSRKKTVLLARSKTLQAVRRFFIERDFIEVETPVRIATPALEPHIDAEPSGDRYLRTSPELHMKMLLAAGYERIFQMGPCFRMGEYGRMHNPEYTMLEWYRANADYIDMLADAKSLLAFVLRHVLGRSTLEYCGNRIEALPIWDSITVEEAFLMFAGWNPVTAYDADRFDIDMVEKVQPRLPSDRPAILKDYPVGAGGLAHSKAGRPEVAERWELFIGGMELANAFSELTDAAEQRRRFDECAHKRREMNKEVYPLDEQFLAALENGMPPCGGVAVGIDRLVMLVTDSPTIHETLAFC